MSDLLLKMPTTYEPLRKNRFVFRFPADLGIQEWTVESGKRPSITQNATEIQFLNTSTWVLGRYTWQEMQSMKGYYYFVTVHSVPVTGQNPS